MINDACAHAMPMPNACLTPGCYTYAPAGTYVASPHGLKQSWPNEYRVNLSLPKGHLML